MLHSLIQELKSLKKEGTSGVYISDETWLQLQHLKKSKNAEAQSVLSNNTPASALSHQRSEVNQTLKDHPKKPAQKLQTVSSAKPSSFPNTTQFILPEGDKLSRYTYLKDLVLNCPVCNAHIKPGKKIVMGVGDLDASIFFCGEAPGAEEEIQGEPFVGPAGQLLTRIIQAMGLSREKVYIANIMNWRPEMPTPFGNRPPSEEEMAFCMPYLKAQLAIVQPKVVVALGATAVNGLLGADPNRKMGEIRGQWQAFGPYPVMPTYHPSYLLRNATLKAKRQVWEDMLATMERIQLPISEKQRGFFSNT